MKLPSLPFLKRKNHFSYFLVLVLRNEKVNAVIFEEIEEKIRVVGQHAEYFDNSIEEASFNEMLDVLDKAISRVEESLPENIETQKTIFGVKEDWVENDKIKKEYLIKLKKVSDELGLTPIGFLIISQAISHLLQKEEGAPVSAILAELSKNYATVSLIRAGRIMETKTSDIHESVANTVDTLLKHFQTSEILPSRIILFDGEKDLSQEFIAHSWSKSLPFLHLPQIASLPHNFDAKAVLFGAAAQMGFEVLQESKQKDNKPIRQMAEEAIKTEESSTSEDFGFIKEKDVTKGSVHQNQDLPKAPKSISYPRLPINIATLSKGAKNIFAKIVHIGKKMRAPTGKKNILIFAIIIISIIAFILFYLFGTKATVVLNIKPKIVEKNQDVTFSTSEPTDQTHNIIRGDFISVSEEGSSSTPATGKKDVGDQAKGKVTVFNSLSQSKTLSQQTTIKAPNGLEFTLDETLTIKGVASHSADETISPSTAQVAVTAAQIGKESNLPSGTKFSVAAFDTTDIVAKNDNPFSGGSKKEVTVVSKKDVNNLEEELPKNLEPKAKDHLLKQISSDNILLPVFINKTLSKKSLDKDIGQQASQVTIKATVLYEGVSYSKKDLMLLARTLLQSSVSNDMTINYNMVKVDVKDINQKNKIISANLHIKGLLQPKIDEKSLASDLSGSFYQDAKSRALHFPQVESVDISFSPSIPILPKILSKNSKNIKIVININE